MSATTSDVVPRWMIPRVLIPFALGYFLSYAFRVINAVLAPDLIAELSLGPQDLGLLTATYFLTFALFQLPLGMLLDRFGPRRVEAALLLFAALGAYLFSIAEGLAGLVLARALIGFGVSACLMGAFKAFVLWFPRERLPLINGVQMAAGGMGALVATQPVALLLECTDWRGIFVLLACATLLAAALILWMVPEHEAGKSHDNLQQQIRGLWQVVRSPLFIRVVPWAVTAQAGFLAIQGLWSGPWLRDVAGLEREAMADVLLVTAAAMVFGFLSLGALSERLTRGRFKLLTLAVSAMTLFMAIQVVLVLSDGTMPTLVWVLFGFAGTSSILIYAVLSQHFPVQLTGRSNTALNFLVFTSAFLLQWGIGAVIEQWPVTVDGRYAVEGYRMGFGLVLGLQVVSMVWFYWRGRGLGHDKI